MTLSNTPAAPIYRNAAPASGFGTSLQEIVICMFLVAALTALVWTLFSALPAYGAQPTQPPVVQVQPTSLAPICWDHTREQVQAEGAPQGCPADPMAYRAATLHQSSK